MQESVKSVVVGFAVLAAAAGAPAFAAEPQAVPPAGSPASSAPPAPPAPPAKNAPSGAAPPAKDAPPVAAPALEIRKASAGPWKVDAWDEVWTDAARGRDLRVRINEPRVPPPAPGAAADATPRGPFPVIVFSHGLGGSSLNSEYVKSHLASHGYLVIAPTHPGSDGEALRRARDGERGAAGWVQKATSDPDNLRERPRDITFILDQLARNPRWGPKADLDRVGAAGHSFGAYTACAVAGLRVDLPEDKGGKDASFRDPRIDAILPMSPQGPGVMGVDVDGWQDITVPVMFLTGTKDYGQGNRAAEWRRAAFDRVKGVDAFLVTLTDGTHMTFGRPSRNGSPSHEELIRSTSLAFFDATLKNDADASAWLDAAAKTPIKEMAFEAKRVKKSTAVEGTAVDGASAAPPSGTAPGEGPVKVPPAAPGSG